MDDSEIEVKSAFPSKYHACEGVKNDFQKVVDRFLSSDSVRYTDFLQIWHDMNFHHIFRGRETKSKLTEFCEECLSLATELWIESADFQVQVCGLYLLYGLYFCQPLEPKSSIRMTLPMWHVVQEFIQSVKEFSHYDVEYIYMKLLLAKAFHFVATLSKTNALESTDYRRKKILGKEESKTQQVTTMIHQLIEPDNILKLEVIDQQYQQMKRNLGGEQGTPDLSLSVLQTDLIDTITNEVTTFKTRRLGAVNAPRSESSDGEETVAQKLRQKAAASKRTAPVARPRRKVVCRRPRHAEEENDVDHDALGEAVRNALNPRFMGQLASSSINMPSVMDFSDDLVIDESEETKTPNKKRKSTQRKVTPKVEPNTDLTDEDPHAYLAADFPSTEAATESSTNRNIASPTQPTRKPGPDRKRAKSLDARPTKLGRKRSESFSSDSKSLNKSIGSPASRSATPKRGRGRPPKSASKNKLTPVQTTEEKQSTPGLDKPSTSKEGPVTVEKPSITNTGNQKAANLAADFPSTEAATESTTNRNIASPPQPTRKPGPGRKRAKSLDARPTKLGRKRSESFSSDSQSLNKNIGSPASQSATPKRGRGRPPKSASKNKLTPVQTTEKKESTPGLDKPSTSKESPVALKKPSIAFPAKKFNSLNQLATTPRRRGRPPGKKSHSEPRPISRKFLSKFKSKKSENEDTGDAPVKRGRGRPPGTKNKPKKKTPIAKSSRDLGESIQPKSK